MKKEIKQKYTFIEIVVASLLFCMVSLSAFVLMASVNDSTIKKVYKMNVELFVDTINKNPNVKFEKYKDEINPKIICQDLMCSYLTDYKSSSIKNNPVIIDLNEKGYPIKLKYNFNSISANHFNGELDKNGTERYYSQIIKSIKDNVKGAGYYVNNNQVSFEDCYKVNICMFVIALKEPS